MLQPHCSRHVHTYAGRMHNIMFEHSYVCFKQHIIASYDSSSISSPCALCKVQLLLSTTACRSSNIVHNHEGKTD